jgi:predicted phage replisome organizer
MAEKKYYWLKLQDNFMNSKEIKKLRRIAGGDTYTCIYLKILLLSIKTEGKIIFEGIEENFVDELSLEIDESVENIKMTLLYLEKHNLIENISEYEYILKYTENNIGSISSVADRVKKHRENKKMLQCNTNLLQSNVKTLQCNVDVTACNTCNTEKRREEKREEKREEREKETHTFLNNFFKEEVLPKYFNQYGFSKITIEELETIYEDKENFLIAIENYKDKTIQNNTPEKYIYNFSTFCNVYKDYIEVIEVKQKNSDVEEWING